MYKLTFENGKELYLCQKCLKEYEEREHYYLDDFMYEVVKVSDTFQCDECEKENCEKYYIFKYEEREKAEKMAQEKDYYYMLCVDEEFEFYCVFKKIKDLPSIFNRFEKFC